MTEQIKEKSGRTYADALVEIFSTWKPMSIISVIIFSTFLVIHFSAEPGTPVEFLGVVKYQKAKPAPPPVSSVQADDDETESYLLPNKEQLSLEDSMAIPILNGTLAIQSGRHVLKLVGDSIAEVRIGSRNIDGTPDGQPYREKDVAAIFSTNTYVEIEFRKKYFAVEVRDVEQYKKVAVTVTKLPKPTLKLRKIIELKEPTGDG